MSGEFAATQVSEAAGLDPVRRRDKNNDRNREGAEVLLMLQILIGRQEGVELTRRQSQQLAVSDARPAHRRDGADLVLLQKLG